MQASDLVGLCAEAASKADPMAAVRDVLEGLKEDLDAVASAINLANFIQVAGHFDNAAKRIVDDRTGTAALRDEQVPDIDPDYQFDQTTTMAILAGFAFNRPSDVVRVHDRYGRA